MPSNEKKRADTSIKVAKKWRSETGIYIGYVMVYQGKFFDFCEKLPSYPDRKNCPSAVDIHNNVYVVVGAGRDRWVNIYEHARGNNGANQDHISVIAKQEMEACFPQSAENIREWFNDCKTDLKSKKWKRFELITLRQAFDCLMAGISLDRVLCWALKG